MAAIYVHNPSEVPEKEHWVILEAESIHIPGDERSRTNPGHGYPASTEHYVSYVAYLNKEEFEAALTAAIKTSRNSGKTVRGIHVVGVMEPETIIKFTEKK